MKYIYGLNKSGRSIIDYLDSINENYFCWDDNYKKREELKNINNAISYAEPNNLNFKLIDESFITPGVSFKDKKIQILKNNKIPLLRDLELYSRISKDKKIIAITGTNGKSTTTKLISDVLKKNNIKNFVGGNIGLPLLECFKEKNKLEFHVIELSSFQLEYKTSLKPYISVLLNISPDHLDRYKSYDEYATYKEKIIHLNKNGFNIVSIDDSKTLEIYKKNIKNVIPVSLNYIEKGIFFDDYKIIDNFFEDKKIIKIPKISNSLFGKFNQQNILAAYTVTKILKININNFLKTVEFFKGLPHRLENVYNDKNLQIINNSKATNVESLIKSVENFENIFLIVGGRAKESDFTKILNFNKKIKKIYLIGESSKKIFEQLKNDINCEICHTLEESIENSLKNLKNTDKKLTVLFSPGCTSFDQYENFEARGQSFKKIVKKFVNEI